MIKQDIIILNKPIFNEFYMTAINIRFVILSGLSALCFTAPGQDLNPAPYDIGSPVLTELWVDPVQGDDARSGLSAADAVQTMHAAWNIIPLNLTNTGFRINILSGNLPFDELCSNYYDNRHGSRTCPVIISAFNGAGTVVIEGGMNIANCRFLYLVDLTLAAGGSLPAFGNNVLHFEACTNVLARGATLTGPDPVQNPDNYDIQEVIKANQCGVFYLEDCDVSGTYQTAVDLFSVQSGHIISSRVHGAGEWGMYLKGGSAYFLIHGNRIYDCGLGFRAGEGSNLEVMRAPWFHYECYDLKFANNIVHDIRGVGLSVCGAYNFLAACNTFVRVATNAADERDYPLLELVHGSRGCQDTSENGEGNAEDICRAFLDQGAWGTAVLNEEGEWIPDKNVFIYNNIFYNPAPSQTMRTHFWVQAAITPPAITRNIPSPSRCDDNAVIRGNLIWNGPADHPLGIDNSTELNADTLRAENSINTIEPELVDPARDNFRPLTGGTVFSNRTYAIPAFAGGDSPYPPTVPAGNLTNDVLFDFDGQLRAGPAFAGALSPAASAAGADPAMVDNTGAWRIWFSSAGYQMGGPWNFGVSGMPIAADFDADGKADPAIVSASGGLWYIWFSRTGYQLSGGPWNFDVAGIPVAADFDGDSKADPAMVSAGGGLWYVWFSGMGYQLNGGPWNFGVAGDPVAADFDGDGKADPGIVYDTLWYIWFSGTGYQLSGGPWDFGVAGDPVAADFDADGKADPAMVVDSLWYIWFSGTGYQLSGGPWDFGGTGTPVAADFDGQ